MNVVMPISFTFFFWNDDNPIHYHNTWTLIRWIRVRADNVIVRLNNLACKNKMTKRIHGKSNCISRLWYKMYKIVIALEHLLNLIIYLFFSLSKLGISQKSLLFSCYWKKKCQHIWYWKLSRFLKLNVIKVMVTYSDCP